MIGFRFLWLEKVLDSSSKLERIVMDFFCEYLNLMSLSIENIDSALLEHAVRLISSSNEKDGKIILAGNGGSAAIASHISTDLTNSAKIRAINFNDPSLVTCFSNDYGYEKWVEKAIESYAHKNDAAILISSSGRSKNIINAALKAKELGLDVITFSGFDSDNPLRQTGDMNFWVDSHTYNIVEAVHNVWLSAIVDRIASDSIKGFMEKDVVIPVVSLVDNSIRLDSRKHLLRK